MQKTDRTLEEAIGFRRNFRWNFLLFRRQTADYFGTGIHGHRLCDLCCVKHWGPGHG